jgi:hypothetical protein
LSSTAPLLATITEATQATSAVARSVNAFVYAAGDATPKRFTGIYSSFSSTSKYDALP